MQDRVVRMGDIIYEYIIVGIGFEMVRYEDIIVGMNEFVAPDEMDKLEKITIYSPLGDNTLTNVSFNSILEAGDKEMQNLIQTSFFSKVVAHLTVKRKTNRPFFEDYYNTKLLTIMEQTRITEQFMENISKASSEEELLTHQEKYQQQIFAQKLKSQQYIKSQSIKFQPCLYFEVKKKSKGYFNFNQEVTSRGFIQLGGRVGLRENILPYDTFELNYSSRPSLLHRAENQLSAEWVNRTRRGNYSIKASTGTSQLYRDIDNAYRALEFGFTRRNQAFDIQASVRSPSLFKDIPNHCRLNYHLPSTKVSFKYKKVLENSLITKDITSGTYSEIKTEIGLPFISSARFFKLHYTQKKYFDIYWMTREIKNNKIKKLLYYSSLERNFSADFCFNYSKHSSVVDFLDNISVRGFDKGSTPIQTIAQMKSSFKFNVHNYPILFQGNLVPFFYAQAGLALLRDKTIRPHAMGSTGIGLGFSFHPSFKIELLSTFFSLQSTRLQQPIRFQIRFSLND